MLTEKEWEIVGPLLENSIRRVKASYRGRKEELSQAFSEMGKEACAAYEKLTGFHETNFNALWHHRLTLYGPECPACGHLLRTSKASFCAHCGRKREDG